MTEQILIDQLYPHPDNPRLFLREEVINSIAEQIKESGKFDEAHALLVRPLNGHYEIIQGHHRREGALKAGLDSVPCWIREMTDDEAYMALALGNVQGELSPLEIGVHALGIDFDKRGKGAEGGGLKGYARLTGQKAPNVTLYRQGANVLKSINYNIIINKKDVLDKAAHLAHIHKAPESTWSLLAQWLITPNAKGKTPSANKTDDTVKAIKKYSIPDEYSEFYPIEGIVKAYLETEQPDPTTINELVNMVRSLESVIQTNFDRFGFDVFPFSVDGFHQWLGDGVGTYTWNKARLTEYRNDVILAAQEAYRPQPADCQPGEWYKLGDHLLYCGDTSQPEFYDNLPSVPFIFADPPYNADVGKWDNDFVWDHDWIGGKGKVAAVTPGIANIQSFFVNDTKLINPWSMACWISNGMTRGAMGFGNWIYIALFSQESLHKNTQDFIKVSIRNSDTKDSEHRGRKPPQLMEKLIEIFSDVGDTIIDPFLGSGTTLFEADKLGRKCIGGEINPDFCNSIIDRWQDITGQAAEMIT